MGLSVVSGNNADRNRASRAERVDCGRVGVVICLEVYAARVSGVDLTAGVQAELLKDDDLVYQANSALRRKTRGFIYDVGASHPATPVANVWLNASVIGYGLLPGLPITV
jgi:hypothetical protein